MRYGPPFDLARRQDGRRLAYQVLGEGERTWSPEPEGDPDQRPAPARPGLNVLPGAVRVQV